MKKILPCLVTVALLLGCRSTPHDVLVECTCGQPIADVEGCAHALCVAGKTNPDNPDCVCGSFSLPKEK